MSHFLEKLNVTTENGKIWTLHEPMDYEIGRLGSGQKIEVPEGFQTDFGSVPQCFWWLVSPIGLATRAFVIHDWLYHTQELSRALSDSVLLEAMGVLGVPWWKRVIIYDAVRAFGWIPWRKTAKEKAKCSGNI